jgi:hypothetical protein
VGELGLLDREQEHGPLGELERDRPLGLELAVPPNRLVEELADPGRGLPEEEASVSSGRARSNPAAVDDEDALAGLRKEAGRRATGDARPDDDSVGAL